VPEPETSALAERRERRVVRVPDGLSIERRRADEEARDPYRHEALRRDDLTITWRWRSRKHLGLISFALLWNAFIAFWLTAVAAMGGPWPMLAFGSLFALVGVGLAYAAAAAVVNRTRVDIEGAGLRVGQRPLPTRAAVRILADEVDQIYVAQTTPYTHNEVPVIAYTVRARLRSAREIDLVAHMDTPEQALWVEQQLENCLGIEDRAVLGEIQAGSGRPAFLQPWDGPEER
jgi:hypothetical protein